MKGRTPEETTPPAGVVLAACASGLAATAAARASRAAGGVLTASRNKRPPWPGSAAAAEPLPSGCERRMSSTAATAVMVATGRKRGERKMSESVRILDEAFRAAQLV